MFHKKYWRHSGICAKKKHKAEGDFQDVLHAYTLPRTHVCTQRGFPCAFLKIETILKNMPCK